MRYVCPSQTMLSHTTCFNRKDLGCHPSERRVSSVEDARLVYHRWHYLYTMVELEISNEGSTILSIKRISLALSGKSERLQTVC